MEATEFGGGPKRRGAANLRDALAEIKRDKWTPADRMVLAALRDRLPRSAWAALRVQPETVLGPAPRPRAATVGGLSRSAESR